MISEHVGGHDLSAMGWVCRLWTLPPLFDTVVAWTAPRQSQL